MQDEYDEATPETAHISRRNFLKGAALAGAGALGAGSLVACANPSEGESSTTEGAPGVSTNADVERYADGWVDTPATAPIPPVEPPAAWDKEADIVVVGGGGGGLMAALCLAKAGKSVVLLEKADMIGGSTGEAMLWVVYGGVPRLWGDWGMYGTPYSHEQTLRQNLEHYEYSVDYDLCDAMLKAGPKAVEAALDAGIDLVDYLWQFYGDGAASSGLIVPREYAASLGTTQQPICNGLKDAAEAAGVEIAYLTPAKSLVVENGRVLGVLAVDNATGADTYYKGSTAIVLTAGGIGANRDLLKRYVPVCGVGAATATVMPTTTGECIRMGLGLGAGIAGRDAFSVRDGGIEPPADAVSMYRSMFDGGEALCRQPWLGFNARGERLHYFTTDTPDMIEIGNTEKYTCMQDMSTFGNRRIVVFDSDFEEHVTNFNESGARSLYEPGGKQLSESQSGLSKAVNDSDWREGLQRGLDGGYIKKADTLEELASQLEVEVAIVKKCVDEWNAACESGEAEELWGYRDTWLIPIKNPPFYGAKTGAAVQGTGAGLLVNASMQVLTEEAEVIPGLYAGFQTAGGFGGWLFNDMGMFGGAGGSYTGGYMAYEGILANESS
ncbi:MAG: FAD-dependent oxidoreductase [Coriobacteriales bacterium]|nr:FAD-dependent oxidoreductase [Coriobacteriales bacterium]